MCTTISKHLSPPSVHDHVYSSQWKFWCVAGTNMWECISCFMHMYPNPEFESMTPLPVLIQWWQRTFVIYMWLFFFSTRYAGSNCAGATGCVVDSCARSVNKCTLNSMHIFQTCNHAGVRKYFSALPCLGIFICTAAIIVQSNNSAIYMHRHDTVSQLSVVSC